MSEMDGCEGPYSLSILLGLGDLSEFISRYPKLPLEVEYECRVPSFLGISNA